MIKNLLLSKRMFLEAVSFSEKPDLFSSGLAVSLFQDAVEIFIWALVKDKSIQVKEGSGFVANVDSLQKSGVQLSHIAKLYELNKTRVNFKHYGTLPDRSEIGKYQAYVEDFLRDSFLAHFAVDFNIVSLSDLISDKEILSHIKSAEQFCVDGSFNESLAEAAKARSIIFSRLEKILPPVDKGLREVDSELRKIPEFGASRAFRYLSDYLSALREATISALIKFPTKDIAYLNSTLPSALQFGGGYWQVTQRGISSATQDACQKSISILIDLAIRIESSL